MTTKSTSLGYKFSNDYVTNSWYDHVNNGEYTPEQQGAIVDALTQAQVDEFEARLPDNHYWLIHTGELQYPAGDDTAIGDQDELMSQAVDAVCARFPKIEARALANLR